MVSHAFPVSYERTRLSEPPSPREVPVPGPAQPQPPHHRSRLVDELAYLGATASERYGNQVLNERMDNAGTAVETSAQGAGVGVVAAVQEKRPMAVEASPSDIPPSKKARTQKSSSNKATTKQATAKRKAPPKTRTAAPVVVESESENLLLSLAQAAALAIPAQVSSGVALATVPAGDFTFRAQSSREPSSDATVRPGALMTSTGFNTPARTPQVAKAVQIEVAEEDTQRDEVVVVPAPALGHVSVTRRSERVRRKPKRFT